RADAAADELGPGDRGVRLRERQLYRDEPGTPAPRRALHQRGSADRQPHSGGRPGLRRSDRHRGRTSLSGGQRPARQDRRPGAPLTTTAISRRSGLRLALLAFTQFLVALDYNIVYVALPDIGRGLGFTAQ